MDCVCIDFGTEKAAKVHKGYRAIEKSDRENQMQVKKSRETRVRTQ
jgi:hypothetical protein